MPQASPSIKVQQWISDPGTNSNKLIWFPNIKRVLFRLNLEIPFSTPAERLLTEGCDALSIKKGRLPNNFERQLILRYSRFCKLIMLVFGM